MVVNTTGRSSTSRSLSTASATPVPVPLGDPVLDAAVLYFGTHGLRSTALDDIASSGELDVREMRRRYPSSRYLALGIFERMLDLLQEQLQEQLERGATLTERLQGLFERELQLLEPCKALVQSWLMDSANPFSPSALLQGPLAFRYATQIRYTIELARRRGEVSPWTLSAVAAGAFVALRRSLVLGWLVDNSAPATRTLTVARAEIAAFVRLLAPWPGFVDAIPSHLRAGSIRKPRVLSASIEPTAVGSRALPLPVAVPSLPGESANEAVQAAAVQTAAVQMPAVDIAAVQTAAPLTAAVSAASIQPPVVLGALAQTASAPEPRVGLMLEGAPKSRVSGVLPIENRQATRVTGNILWTEFRSDGGELLAPAFELQPHTVQLDPAQRVLVQVAVPLPHGMRPDVLYRGEFTVEGALGTRVVVELRAVPPLRAPEPPTVDSRAPAPAKPGQAKARTRAKRGPRAKG